MEQLLHNAEAKIRKYFSQRSQCTEDFATWLSDEKDGEDINWLLHSGDKKVSLYFIVSLLCLCLY